MGILEDQVAIITGTGQGLGKAVALEFAQEGASVAWLDINPDTVEEVRGEIEREGGDARAYTLGISDYDAYGKVVEDVIVWKGKIDTLVSNAAIAIYGTILDDTLENWRKQITVNLEAVYMGAYCAAALWCPVGDTFHRQCALCLERFADRAALLAK